MRRKSSIEKQYLRFVIGKDMEGVVAATKRLINARTRYLKPNVRFAEESVIEDKDTLGISVMDLMHNAENHQYYRQKNSKFQSIVEDILVDNNFEIAIKPVRTYNDNTTLRMKNE